MIVFLLAFIWNTIVVARVKFKKKTVTGDHTKSNSVTIVYTQLSTG